MGNPAGVKRDFEALENRRFSAFRLLKKGLSEAEVARQVGVHRQSVNRWAKQIGEQGRDGLKKAGRAGRKSRLREADLKRLESGLKRGPQALGYETNLWTLERVAELIERNCGVKYHPGHVGWLVHRVGALAPWAAGNSMNQPLGGGKSGAGLSLKKSPARKPHDSVH